MSRPARDLAPCAWASLGPAHRWAVHCAVAAQCLEGWAPTTEDVEFLIADARGDEVVGELARRHRQASPPRERRRIGRRRVPYLIAGSSVLANTWGIDDAARLAHVESLWAALRTVHVLTGRAQVTGEGIHRLLPIHAQIFGDTYPWAGSIRTVDISKGTTTFTPVAAIWEVLIIAHESIRAARWDESDRGRMAYQLARVYAEINHAHPFREGNGRSATTLLQLLTAPSPLRLDLARVDSTEWITASRESAPFRVAGTPSPRPLIPVFLSALIGPERVHEVIGSV